MEMRAVRQLLTSSCSQMTWYAPGRRWKSLCKKKKKKKGRSLPFERSRLGIRACVVPERERPLCPTHTSYCIPDAYGRWEFVITPTSGRRMDDSRVAGTQSEDTKM